MTSWRMGAAQIVEELFQETSSPAWNDLLDLRVHLVEGSSWEQLLGAFLRCRHHLERDHYLPFYRLRKLLAASLQLEVCLEECWTPACSLAELLRETHPSYHSLKRRLEHRCFEHYLNFDRPEEVKLRITEAAQ